MIIIMRRKFLQLLVLLFIVCLCPETSGGNGLVGAESNVLCLKGEREALLRFKQGFKNPPLDPLLSWEAEEDCCRWKEVGCNNITGHVTTLDLHSSGLSDFSQGEFIQSLFGLPYLRYLDLSQNDFHHAQIPELLGSFPNLEHLNLFQTNFRGMIPDHLGNLSRLQFLDLSGNGFSLRASGLDWVSSLSSLKVLVLDEVDLSATIHWLDAINMLPSLVDLSLRACRLSKLPKSLPHGNFTSLQSLDLSSNNFKSKMPNWLFHAGQSIVHLNLSRNMLHGLIPEGFGNMTSLTVLDLSVNDLQGPIPVTLGMKRGQNHVRKASYLTELYLSQNQLNGSLEKSLARLSELIIFDVSWNQLEGNLTEVDFLNFRSLKVLDLSSNLLGVNVSSSWIPNFQLERIGLQSCRLGSRFPEWLQNQQNLLSIDISNAGIADTVPEWFWNLSPKIEYMNLSDNSLRGSVPDLSSNLELSALDLSYNSFQSPLPHFPPNLKTLILSENSFFGPLSHICEMLSRKNTLSYLKLSRNSLSGLLPDCWTNGQNLVYLDLSMNYLLGPIPVSVGHLVHLYSLILSYNNLSGEVPSSLKDCTSLVILDLSYNNLAGEIPSWIGGSVLNLLYLRLRSNSFHGGIPGQLCQLKSLSILDLSANHISGNIPRCIRNFNGMADLETVTTYVYPDTVFRDYQMLVLKYYRPSILNYGSLSADGVFSAIDLSSNDISGEVPRELTSLTRLSFLILSNNQLVGTIPSNLGALTRLEVLDLSRNQLSCMIPSSLNDLVSLVIFDVSYNKLSGRIPKHGQLSTFVEDSYSGNDNLCGFPLASCSKNGMHEDPNCSKEESRGNNESSQEDSDGSRMPFYISIALGFVTGFWGFLGTFLFHRTRRHAYYRFLDNTYDKIYVIVAIHMGRLRRKFQIPVEQKR